MCHPQTPHMKIRRDLTCHIVDKQRKLRFFEFRKVRNSTMNRRQCYLFLYSTMSFVYDISIEGGRMRTIVVLTILVAVLYLFTGAETLMIRDPAVSPEGGKVAFSLYGDLWVYTIADGNLQHLTHNIDYDYRPLWSPDGKHIAFTSNRYGNYDVYTIPATGGNATRLTWHSLTDTATDWSADGRLYVMTYRDAEGVRTYSMKPDGSDYRMVVEYTMQFAKANKKGDILCYDSIISPWQKEYTGNGGGRILLYSSGKTIEYVIKDSHMNISPVWGENNSVYYISNKNGTYGIRRFDSVTKTTAEVLKVPDGDIKSLYATPDGRFLSFQYMFKAAVFDTRNAKLTVLPIHVNADEALNSERTFKIGTNDIDEVELSPDGKRFVMISNGDIIQSPLLSKKDKKKADAEEPLNLTDSVFWEHDVMWSPDNTMIAYATTQYGATEICTMNIHSKKTTRITRTDNLEANPVFSPDGTMLAYVRSLSKLVVYNLATGTEKELATMPFLSQIQWRPDSKALTFSANNEIGSKNVYVVTLEGFSRQVSLHPEWDRSPVWNDDGSKLYWLSTRFGRSHVMEISFADKDISKVVNLQRDSDSRIVMKQRIVYQTNDSMSDCIWLTGESALGVLINGSDGADIWKVPVESGDPEKIAYNTGATFLRVLPGAKKIAYINKNRAYTIAFGGGSLESLDAPVWKTERKDELHREIFDEAWSFLRERFYDAKMHGRNWDKIRAKYEKLLPHVRLNNDLYILIRDMLGELNASHLGIWGKEAPSQSSNRTTAHWGGRLTSSLTVNRVYAWGPAEGKVAEGDTLLAIQGIPVKTLHDVDRALIDRKGKKTTFTFSRAKTITIECSDRNDMFYLYRTFKDHENKRIVQERSSDSIAYIHLHAMMPPDLNQFMEELGRDAIGKKALIIDVRNNSGGRIAESILDMIEREVYAYSQSRVSDSEMVWPSGYAWTKPVVVLINEGSFSNAEIFPSGFKSLKLGTIIGTTTSGGVIGTNDVQLVDGTTFRLPHVKWRTKDGKNMENLGITPDIEVDRTPADILRGNDPQLDRAIEELLKKVK